METSEQGISTQDIPILKRINEEIINFQSRLIQIVPLLYFNQWKTINKIFFYFNSKYVTGETDVDGDRKYFYNIVKNPCKIFTKSIDFDTKDIKLITTGGGDPLKTWFMERDLDYWMRDVQFGKILSRIFRELPIFGSVVLKEVNGTVEFVDLRNLIMEQSAESLDQSNYIDEVHYYTPSEFRRVAKGMPKWKQKDVEEVISEFHKMKNTSYIKLYERYGDVTLPDQTYQWSRTFIADVGVNEYDANKNLVREYVGVELSTEPWEGHPYWEFHTEKIPGRWLGVGVVEMLFEPQIRHNEIVNVQAKATYWAGMRLFFSKDPKAAGNLMSEKNNGDVIIADDPVTQVDMSDRNLAFFNEETMKWDKNISDLTIAFAPTGRSAVAVQIAQQQVASYFQQIQKDLAQDLKEMLYEAVMPSFEKANTKEHTLRLVGQDLDIYIGMIKNQMVLQEIIRVATKPGGQIPQSKDVIEAAVTASLKQKKEHNLTIPKDFYKNLKYDIDINIVSEAVDVKSQYAARTQLLQAMTADPTMTTDPFKKKLLLAMIDDAGLSQGDFYGLESPKPSPIQPQQGAGGGVSAPMQGMASLQTTKV